MFNELALFAGCGGGLLSSKLLGWRTTCAVELERYRCLRIAQRQNEGHLEAFPIWCGDIRGFDGKRWRNRADMVSGGFPCQDISVANTDAAGIDGARSGLWKEQLRILREVGDGNPTRRKPILWVENSPMLVARGLGTILQDLAELGYDARWCVLGADDIGGFHIRKRLFLVGYADRARLEGLAWNGDAHGGAYSAGYTAAAGVRVLADADSSRKHELQGGGTEVRQWAGNGSDGCLWADARLYECRDGKIRAIKPGLCGMADGVANRVDRISAIGDGQVPAVVAAAFQLLTKL
jgi:DNA (cytosine-5)-methyltransferase 1